VVRVVKSTWVDVFRTRYRIVLRACVYVRVACTRNSRDENIVAQTTFKPSFSTDSACARTEENTEAPPPGRIVFYRSDWSARVSAERVSRQVRRYVLSLRAYVHR